ncbi:hypothetical protein [Kribbella sp. NPDC050470]|uniref:hypothetical protein n=1 Tax=unclassified Kribbella TaxID=2644121 RepID=UPI003794AD84
MTDEIEPDPNTEISGAAEDGELEYEAMPSTALVQFEDGLAVLYGDHVPDGVELIPFTLIGDATRASISTVIPDAVGFGNNRRSGSER